MTKTKNELYKDTVKLLDCLELVIHDKRQFALIRKKILDLANDIMKCGDLDGE